VHLLLTDTKILSGVRGNHFTWGLEKVLTKFCAGKPGRTTPVRPSRETRPNDWLDFALYQSITEINPKNTK